MGDNQGPERDRQHMHKILSHLHKNGGEIHAIVLLFPPSDARLSTMMTSCLNDLLQYFDADVAKNFIFCYTKTRPHQFNTGKTGHMLRDFVREHHMENIALNTENQFCVDNEGIQYLIASR